MLREVFMGIWCCLVEKKKRREMRKPQSEEKCKREEFGLVRISELEVKKIMFMDWKNIGRG